MNKELLQNKIDFRKSVKIGSTEWAKVISIDIDNHNPCRCGHVQIWHFNSKDYCGGIKTGVVSDYEDLCECESYRPADNLKYLEYLYEQRSR